MFVFTGYGIITLLIGFASLVGFGVSLKNEFILQYLNSAEASSVICCIAAWVNARIGIFVNSKPGRILIDPKTMQQVELKERHTFFWLPMEYWSFVPILLGVFLSYNNIIK
ncbi:hypothetical protein EKO29_14685 [Colwellia sp. Arc7-635]|uniref:hypothetical protein n=1 Tax=Colwellia sp. Arc7-635 TaxID=2497879 RepID=UPI000F8579D7|nr:hypothetical protein [Colwellia sp. Arc7-635]AZQ85118.1 hypothetical protein EKO29_14685 [Colwellia sp. Arc7-635]